MGWSLSRAWGELTDGDNWSAIGNGIVDGAAAVGNGIVDGGSAAITWTTDTAYPWVKDTGLPAVGNGIAYAGAGVVAGVENAGAGAINLVAAGADAVGLENDIYIDNPNLLGWDRVDAAHGFYDYVADNPGRSAALASQGVVNGVTSVSGAIVGLGTDAVRGVWNTGEIIVVDGLVNGVIINGSKGLANMGLEEDEDFEYTELQGAERYDGFFKATVGIPRFLNEHTQMQDFVGLFGDDNAFYHAFERPQMEILVDGEGNRIYGANHAEIFLDQDGNVVEDIHVPSDNPRTILVDADGEIHDPASNPEQIAVGPDGVPIDGANPAEILGEDGEMVANPDHIPETMIANPDYVAPREIDNPDYIEGSFAANPDYIADARIVDNPDYNYERGLSYGGQALFEVPAFVAMTVFSGGAAGAVLTTARTGAGVVQKTANVVRAAIVGPGDEVLRATAEGTETVVTASANATTTTAGATNATAAGAGLADDTAARVVQGATATPTEEVIAATATEGSATVAHTTTAAAAATTDGLTVSGRSAEMVHRSQLVKDALAANDRAFRAAAVGDDVTLTTRASNGAARADEIVRGERAGTVLDTNAHRTALTRGMTSGAETGARVLQRADFIEYLAKPAQALRGKIEKLDELRAAGATEANIARAEQAVARAETALAKEVGRVNAVAGRNGIDEITMAQARAATYQMTDRAALPALAEAWRVGSERGLTWVGDFTRGWFNASIEGGGAGLAFGLGYHGDQANAEAESQTVKGVAAEAAGSTFERGMQDDWVAPSDDEASNTLTAPFTNRATATHIPIEGDIIRVNMDEDAKAALTLGAAKY